MKFLQLVLAISMLMIVGCDTAKKTTDAAGDKAMNTTKTMASKNKVMLEGEYNTGGSLAFEADNENYSADGKFNNWYFSKINMEKGNIESLRAIIKVDLTSVWEKSDKLTEHLKAPDFLNIAEFTTAKINVKNVRPMDAGAYKADLSLDMKGLSQEMETEFTVTSTEPYHIVGKAKVNRNLFGLGGDIGVGEFVTVAFDTDIPMGEE